MNSKVFGLSLGMIIASCMALLATSCASNPYPVRYNYSPYYTGYGYSPYYGGYRGVYGYSPYYGGYRGGYGYGYRGGRW